MPRLYIKKIWLSSYEFFKIIYDFTDSIQNDLSEKQMLDLHKSLNMIGKNLRKFKI